RIRRYLTTNPTADADRQQGANGRNLKKNIGTRDQAMEPNVPCAQTEWRMEENIRLQKAKQGTNCETLQDDRHTRYDLNAEKRGLDVHIKYNIGFHPYQSQPTITTISSLPNIRNQLHLSGDAVWDKYCAIYICENDTTNDREGEREISNIYTELCGRYNTIQQQLEPNIKGSNVDSNSIRRDGMDDKQKQKINKKIWFEQIKSSINTGCYRLLLKKEFIIALFKVCDR
ncbi:MAG: hypothetical protein EZS28_054453, partial [Streblomastix strix]